MMMPGMLIWMSPTGFQNVYNITILSCGLSLLKLCLIVWNYASNEIYLCRVPFNIFHHSIMQSLAPIESEFLSFQHFHI